MTLIQHIDPIASATHRMSDPQGTDLIVPTLDAAGRRPQTYANTTERSRHVQPG